MRFAKYIEIDAGTAREIEQAFDLPNRSVTTVEDAIAAVIQAVRSNNVASVVDDKIQGLNGKMIPSGSLSLANSADSARITNRTVDFAVTKGSGKSTVTYDMNAVKNNLPSGFDLRFARAEVVDKAGNRSTALGRTGTIQGPALPATLALTATVATPSGIVDLTKRVPLTDTYTGKTSLTVSNTTAAPTERSIADDLDEQSALIGNLEQRMSDLETAGVATKQSVQEQEILELRAEFESYKTATSAELATLREENTRLKDRVSKLQK